MLYILCEWWKCDTNGPCVSETIILWKLEQTGDLLGNVRVPFRQRKCSGFNLAFSSVIFFPFRNFYDVSHLYNQDPFVVAHFSAKYRSIFSRYFIDFDQENLKFPRDVILSLPVQPRFQSNMAEAWEGSMTNKQWFRGTSLSVDSSIFRNDRKLVKNTARVGEVLENLENQCLSGLPQLVATLLILHFKNHRLAKQSQKSTVENLCLCEKVTPLSLASQEVWNVGVFFHLGLRCMCQKHLFGLVWCLKLTVGEQSLI